MSRYVISLATGFLLWSSSLQHAFAETDAATADRSHLFTAGYARSEFHRFDLDNWHDRFFEYRHFRDQRQAFLRLGHEHHFGTHDNQITAGFLDERRFRWPLEFEASVSPDAEFLPDYSALIGTRLRMTRPENRFGTAIFVPQYRFSSYPNGDVQTLSLGSEYYFRRYDAWLTPGLSFVYDQDGTFFSGWRLGAHWQVRERTRIGGLYADAAETEGLVTTDTTTWYLYLRQQLTRRQLITFSAEHHDREDSYGRVTLMAIWQWRFP